MVNGTIGKLLSDRSSSHPVHFHDTRRGLDNDPVGRFNRTEKFAAATWPVYLYADMHFLTTIGITLAAIGAILIFILKRPLKTSDRLLVAILVCFVIKFSLDEASLITGNSVFI